MFASCSDFSVKCTDCSFLLSLDLVVVFSLLFSSDYSKIYPLFFKMYIQVLFSHIFTLLRHFVKHLSSGIIIFTNFVINHLIHVLRVKVSSTIF